MSNQIGNRIITLLESIGWEFLPYGPNEWQWMKFDHQGHRIAIQGDLTWQDDIKWAEAY